MNSKQHRHPERYTNASDALSVTLDDTTLHRDIEQERNKNTILYAMLDARLRAGLNQNMLAQAMGCSQSTISRIENSNDESITISEMNRWFDACGMSVHIEIDPTQSNTYSQDELIKQYVYAIKERLESLTKVLINDKSNASIIHKIEEFRSEVLLNLLALSDKPKTLRAAEPGKQYLRSPTPEKE